MYIAQCYVRLSISFPFRLFHLIITDIRVAVEMRGLGLVAVLLCVALVLGITIAIAADPVLVKQHACTYAGQRQTGKKPSKGKLLSPPVPRKCSESEKPWLIST